MLFVSQRWAGRAFSYAVAVLFVLATFSGAAFAQTETGQITGKVIDPNGAVVSGASVLVKSVGSGREINATSNEEGFYNVTNLQPGLYDITVNSTGFAPNVQRAQVTVGAKLSIDTQLSVTAVGGDTVTVVAGEGGVEVNTTNQELADVVSATQIRELPTITRNPYALVGISGNVSPGDPSGRGTGFAINGQRAASTNILLDGGENVDTFGAGVGQSVPLDAVQEFRVITSNFSAEYGRASGGIVNVTTRPGTNDFNGTLYAFNRVSRLASSDFDDNAQGLPKSVFTRNQFGYSVGGPIVKNKLFFFSSTEWTRVRSVANAVNFVPTPQLIAASASTTRNFFSQFPLATPINGTVLTVADIQEEFGLASGGAFTSLPASLPAFGQVRYTVPADVGAGGPQNSYQTVARIDYNFSDKTQIYGRYALEDQSFFEGSNASSPYQGFNTGSLNFNQNALLNVTHTLTPNFVSQTKLVYNRLTNAQPLGEQPPSPTLFLRGSTRTRIEGSLVALPGYLPFSPGSAIPFGGPQNLGQVYQDLNYNAGQHQFRFGGQYVYIQDNRTFGAYQNAVAALSTTSTTQGLNNLVLGNLRRFQVAVNPQGNFFPGSSVTLPVQQPNFSRSNRYHEFATYFNDAWRVAPTVTLNLGLRYEYYGIQHNKDESLDANFYYGSGATLQERIRNGRVFRATESPIGRLWNRDLNNFAPRLGFAWDITGDGKTSLRGGYGLAYERNFGNVTFNVIQNPPNYAVVTVDAGTTGFSTISIPNNNLGPLGGSGGTAILPGIFNVRHVNQNIRNAYAHFWSVSFEREILPRTIASIETSSSAGRSLYDLTNQNRRGAGALFFGDADPTSRLNNQYYPLNTRGNNGRSDYHALIASVESSNFREAGLQFTARYTLSRAIDNLSSTFSESSNNFNLGVLDPFNPNLDKGYADFDLRHRFGGSFNYEPQFFRNTSGFARQLLHGFTFTGIVNVRSGLPFSIFDCTSAAFEVCPRLTPTGTLSFDGSSAVRTINDEPNRFSLIDLSSAAPFDYVNPITGTSEFGPFPENMTRRNAFRGPGFWNVDAGVYKNFGITENTRLQLRAEFYNLFNHANLFVRGEDADVSSFDFVPGFKTGRRNIQLAAKFIF